MSHPWTDKEQTSTVCLQESSQENLERIISAFSTDDSIHQYSAEGWQPIHYAVLRGNFSEVAYLCKSGVEVNSPTQSGDSSTPLHLAAYYNHEEIIELLLKAGANPNLKDHHGMIPLHWALQKGHVKAAELLIEENASLNLSDHQGWTPLMWAAYQGHDGLVERLLTSPEIRVNASGREGVTALTLSNRQGHQRITKLLIARGGIDRSHLVGQIHYAFRLGVKDLTIFLIPR